MKDICCRYPQYYAARKLYYNIKKERKLVTADGEIGMVARKGDLLWRHRLRQELHHAIPGSPADEERRFLQPYHHPHYRPKPIR